MKKENLETLESIRGSLSMLASYLDDAHSNLDVAYAWSEPVTDMVRAIGKIAADESGGSTCKRCKKISRYQPSHERRTQ